MAPCCLRGTTTAKSGRFPTRPRTAGAALLNRDLAADGLPPANHKRIFRLMKFHGLLLQKHSGQHPGRSHDGKVVMMRSNPGLSRKQYACLSFSVAPTGQPS